MKTLFSIFLFSTSWFTSTPVLEVNTDAVRIDFVADMQNTKGSIGGFNAKIMFDKENLAVSKISGTAEVNTLNTGIDKRDEHLKSEDYFNAAVYPRMYWNSTTFSQEGTEYIMKGKLKIMDVEREEEIRFQFSDKEFKGDMTIQLAHYKVGNYADKKPEKTNVKVNFHIPVK